MGINVTQWRARIGSFSQPVRIKSPLRTLKLKYISLSIRIVLFMMLAAQCVETNPGPPRRQQQRAASISVDTTSGASGSSVRQSRKDTLNNSHTERMASQQTQSSPSNSQPAQASQPSINMWFDNQQAHGNPYNGQNVHQRTTQQEHTSKQHTQPTQNEDIRELKHIMLSVKSTVDNVESRLNNFEATINEIKQSNQTLVESNAELTSNMSLLSQKVSKLEKDLKSSEDKRESLEAQSRRNNLRIYGIEEARNETWEETEHKVKQYIQEDLKIESDISIERAHRIRGTESLRPAIVKFSFYKDREKVLKAYREKRRENNEADNSEIMNIHVSEDFPSRVMRVRNSLRRFLKKALDEGKRAFFKYDKLVIDGVDFVYDADLDDIVSIR